MPVFSLGAAQSNKDSVSFKSPKGALLRSAIIPGWGQLYVNKPVKSVLFISAEAFVIYKTIHYNKIYGYVEEAKALVGAGEWNSNTFTEEDKKKAIFDSTGYKLTMNSWRPREKRNKYSWWCFGIYIIGMLDAYVDAHLLNFPDKDVEFASFLNKQGVTIVLSISIR